MIDPLIKEQLDIEMDRVVHEAWEPNHNFYDPIKKISYHIPLDTRRKLKKRERLNKAKGRRGSIR